MTFKEFIKKPENKKKVARLIKRMRNTLPQCLKSNHMDTSNMTSPTVLPATGDRGNQQQL